MSIKFTAEEVKRIVYEDHEDFEIVEEKTDYDAMYKYYAPCKIIVFQLSTGKHFAIGYQQYTSHYGDGVSQFEDQEAPEVKLVTKEVTRIVKSWEAV